MSRLICMVVTVVLGIQAMAADEATLAYRIVDAPDIDGVLDDAAWEALPMTTGFVYNRQPDTYAADPYQSELQVGWNDEALFIALKGTEPRMADHLKHAKSKDTGTINWKYQLFEILLDPPTADGHDHYQLGFDLLGHKVAFKAAPTADDPDIKQVTWNKVDFPGRGAVHHGSDFFSMELVLPFEAFGGTPEPHAQWGFQVGRAGAWEMPGVHWQLAGQTVLAPMPSAFWRNWREHSTLEFVPEALLADYQNVGKKTEAINAAYFKWRATQVEAMGRVEQLLARTKGKMNLLRAHEPDPDAFSLEAQPRREQARIQAFGMARHPTEERPSPLWNANWWTTNDGNPRTIVCTWSQPVTLNLHHIDWLGGDSFATEYCLEYWDEGGWELAYAESENHLPISCHQFPAVTTDKVRFTITGMSTRDYYLSIQKFEFYKIASAGGAE